MQLSEMNGSLRVKLSNPLILGFLQTQTSNELFSKIVDG